MAIYVHSLSMLTGSAQAQADRVIFGNLAQIAYDAGNGAVSAVAAGTPGVGYQTIPTVALNIPGSGAKATGSGAAVTALMGVVANPTIAAGGSGGANGAVTLTGTTGTGTKFQITGTIAGNALTAITGITVAGSYSAMPSTLTAEPVTGGSLTGCTVNLSAALGVIGYTVGSGGSNYAKTGPAAALTGGTPTTAGLPGAVTVTSAAGAGCAFDVTRDLPLLYNVQSGMDQDAVVFVSGRSQTGFKITINPRLAASTLAAGLMDLLIVA